MTLTQTQCTDSSLLLSEIVCGVVVSTCQSVLLARLFFCIFVVISRPCVVLFTCLTNFLVMISTTANNKVKNPKGSESGDGVERDDVGQENTDDKVRGYVGSYDASSSFGGPQREGRFRGRGRVTEYRHSRGQGRGAGRGRGAFPPRGERDTTEPYKYHDPLTNDSWSQGASNKYYERSEVVVNLPEDPRISKLLRRLCAEVDVEKSLVICSKLQDTVMLPENARYIRRSYDILVEYFVRAIERV